MKTWQESVIDLIDGDYALPLPKGRDWRFFRYAMPRQVGVTSFLVSFANREARRGKVTAYAAFNRDSLRAVQPGCFQYDPHHELFLRPLLSSKVMAGTSVPSCNLQVLVLDNMRYVKDFAETHFWPNMMAGGIVLWIDTVEDWRSPEAH